jgi:tetratricopeptide (TPR) repeat protein
MPKKPASKKKLSRRERRELDVEISFLQGVVRRDPDFVEALQVLGDAYTRRGRFDAGLEVDEALSKLCPHDPMVLYNLACSYALTKRHEQAGAALLRAVELGYKDFKWLMKDPDLESLRKHPVFDKIKARLKKHTIKVR